MRGGWSRTAVLIAAATLPGCDPGLPGLGGPITLPDPLPCSVETDWQIRGFSDSDLGDGALLLPLGHSRQLFVYEGPSLGNGGCGDEEIVSIRWISTRPDVAGGFEPGPGRRWAWLTGLNPGETRISAEVVLADGGTVTAPLTRLGTPYPVRVVSPPAPPEGRSVLLEGDVALEPEEQTQSPDARAYLVFEVPVGGTLDMIVDWESSASDVIAHMCQGEVAFPLGCSPLIDGTRYHDEKPVAASAETTPGTHTLWITNSGPGPERVTYQVGLTPG